MIETEPRPEDSRALALALALDRAGTRKDLSDRLRLLVGTENEGKLLAATHQAESVLALKAAEEPVAVAEPEERVAEPAAEEPVATAAPSPESDEAIEPVEDVKAMADGADQAIGAMIAQARKFIAAEPDAPDIAAMRAILASLEKLGGSEQAETDASAKKAGSSYGKPSEMPAEVRDHLGKHKKMVSKYGAGPMSDWAAEMGIEQQQASGG